jgi:hypothetical protein
VVEIKKIIPPLPEKDMLYKIIAIYRNEKFSFYIKDQTRWLQHTNIAAIVLSKNTAHFKRPLKTAIQTIPHIVGHEAIHIYQARKLGWTYLPIYIWEWAKAGFRYKENVMEKEAFQNESTVEWYIDHDIRL